MSSRIARQVTLILVSVFFVDACGVRSALDSAGGPSGDGSVMQRPIEVLPETLPSGRTRRAYAQTLSAIGGVGAPYVFAHTMGALPDGLALTSSGELSGTPTHAGTYTFTVEATDAAGGTGERAYTLLVAGPRWMAHFLFISTTSPRSAIALTDYTKPDSEPIYLSEDRANYPAFSPDGRLFSYTNSVGAGAVVAFIVNVEGETPGAPFPLLDSGHIASGASIAWSPDSTRVAYTRGDGATNTLWVAEITDEGVTGRRMIATDVSSRDVTWHAPDAIVFSDAAKRPSVVRFVGGIPARTTFDLPGGTLAAISPDATTVLLFDSAGTYMLGDVPSGNTISFPPGSARWDVSPDFRVVVGRSVATDAFALHDLVGTMVGPVRASGVGTSFYAALTWAYAHARLVQSEQGRIVVTDFDTAPTTRTEIPGGYVSGQNPRFVYDDSRIVFSEMGTIWTSEVNGTSVSNATTILTVSGSPRLSSAPSEPRVLVESGRPVTSHVIDFARSAVSGAPLVRDLGLDLDWTEVAWSSDSSHIAILGAKASRGRLLYLVDVEPPIEAPRIVSICNSIPSEPRCPGSVLFQP